MEIPEVEFQECPCQSRCWQSFWWSQFGVYTNGTGFHANGNTSKEMTINDGRIE